jgi:hypothetical protein
MARSGVVVSERQRIEKIQTELCNIRPDHDTIQKAQDLSREISKIDPNKLQKPFTI